MLAIGFLLLDAVLLGAVAVWDARPGLFAWSGVFVVLAAGTLVLRRRYVRSLEEIARARDALRRELRAPPPPHPSRDR